MSTTTSVDINFDKLEQNIALLRSLLPRMEEPSYDQVNFWLSGTFGSGIVYDHLVEFCNNTITFHQQVYTLIANTIDYLETIKKLKIKDQTIAENL